MIKQGPFRIFDKNNVKKEFDLTPDEFDKKTKQITFNNNKFNCPQCGKTYKARKKTIQKIRKFFWFRKTSFYCRKCKKNIPVHFFNNNFI